ncbi:MAG: hypothetical protein K2Q25_11845 [Mycobacteriaceae bacterium]|nr:hypothetical protein [Mycobacteriaceae bacterium]
MALNTDTARLMSGAAQMETIGNDVLGALGRYVAMNQNLTGTGFAGNAALASLATSEDVATTGRQVGARFQAVIDMIKRSAQEYEHMNEQNRSTLSNISQT